MGLYRSVPYTCTLLYLCPMRATLVPLAIAACLPFSTRGQTMSFGGGQLLVESGTTLTIQGAIDWQLAPDATVVNNGLVDLGGSATVSEPSGAAISGTGMERAQHTASGPWADIVPGGLGLHLSNSSPSAPIIIHRGHVPFTAAGGDASVARWYRIDALSNTDVPVQLVFAYDEDELNDLDEGALVLHASPDPVGNWSDLIGAADPVGNSVSGALQAPFTFVTAYAGDITGVGHEKGDRPALSVWPTVAEDMVRVQCSACTAASRLMVVDASGRAVLDRTLGAGPLTIPVDQWKSGMYSLTIAGIGSVKFVRP